MIYYIVVTLATVGYGDITLKSDEGRICVIVLIVISIVLIPKQTNELIVLMRKLIAEYPILPDMSSQKCRVNTLVTSIARTKKPRTFSSVVTSNYQR